MKSVPTALSLAIALWLAPPAPAQAPESIPGSRESKQAAPPRAPEPLPVLKGRPDAAAAQPEPDRPSDRLAKRFESVSLGISLQPPAGAKMIRRVGDDDVEFVDEAKKWTLKIAHATLSQRMPLDTTTNDKGVREIGLLEVTADKLKERLPGATVLRQDVINVGATDVAMIAVRYVQGLETLLTQQAILKSGERGYYVLNFTTPGSKTAGKEPGDDAQEREAVETFGEMVDTVRVLDQTPLRRDQEDRLYATRALFVNLSARGRIENLLAPKQWFRLTRNGKDIGYVYTVEEMGQGIPGDDRPARRAKPAKKKGAAGPDGILIGTRSRTVLGEDLQVEAESWMFSTLDRRGEEWSSVRATQSLKDKAQQDHSVTLGSSSQQLTRSLYKAASDRGQHFDKEDPNQPPVWESDSYTLNVTHVTKTGNDEPLTQGLPKWYVPQAYSHLLPRLLPLQEKKYLFAVYVEEVRKVMNRYVDVGREAQVTFGGKTFRAIPIRDRIGLEGSVTTHYVSPDGHYLGSENADTGIAVLPSDEATLLGIWKDANLTRPADVQGRGTAAAPAGGAPAQPADAQPAGAERPTNEHAAPASGLPDHRVIPGGQPPLDRRRPSSR